MSKPICPILHEWADGLITEAEATRHIEICADCYAIMMAFRQMSVRKAGRTHSEAKSEAARLNGILGGRPRTKGRK